MTTKLEYRVKPVTRYTVTRYEDTGNTGSVTERGTFDNPDVAYEVAYALCKADHERLGYKVDDERVQYPEHPGHAAQRKTLFRPHASDCALHNGPAKGAGTCDCGATSTEYNTTSVMNAASTMKAAGYVMLTKAEHERLVAAAGPHGVTKPMFEADRIKAEVDRTT